MTLYKTKSDSPITVTQCVMIIKCNVRLGTLAITLAIFILFTVADKIYETATGNQNISYFCPTREDYYRFSVLFHC